MDFCGSVRSSLTSTRHEFPKRTEKIMQNLDEAIRERAYHLWIADGRLDGRADAYWIMAQREILATAVADGTVFEQAACVVPEIDEAKYPAKKAKVVGSARKGKRRAA
jgi:hypothetical protein